MVPTSRRTKPLSSSSWSVNWKRCVCRQSVYYMRLNDIGSSKINTFYLQKEAELKLRLETLLSKRRAAAMRGLPDTSEESTVNHVEWGAVEEGFRLLERDLGKLQVLQ